MEQKIKFSIIGLVGLLLVSLFIIFQVNSSKQSLEKDIERLNGENVSLRKQIDETLVEKRQVEDRANTLKQELDRAAAERDDTQKNFEIAERARQDLLAQIEALKKEKVKAPAPEEGARQPQAIAAGPTTKGDEAYWASLIQNNKDLGFQLGSMRSELKSLQIANEQLQREKSALEMDIATLNREKEDLNRQVDYNQKLINSITQDLVREKNDKTRIQEAVQVIGNENNVLKRQLRSLNNRKISLERKIADVQEKNTTLENRFNEMNLMLRDKMSQIDSIKKQIESSDKTKSAPPAEKEKDYVELPPIVVRPQGSQPNTVSAADKAAMIGKVLAVNRENNFVVIDLGQDQNVKVGDSFQVYRDEKPIANVQVIQARKSISACDIKRETVVIQVNDLVR